MFGEKKRKGRRSPSKGNGRTSGGRVKGGVSGQSRIGRYLIQDAIGQGGMGSIYLANDPVIGREVAIKVITMHPDMGTEQERQYRERFLREARAAGSLVHPNIVAVHDIGQDPALGCPYIVMEYVAGWDLKKVIEARAPLPARTVVKIGLRIASALDYAHERGIVHRDIKPANVLIGENAEVKLTDFGVARLPGSELTRTDQFIGSPGFMAPEQLAGGAVDGRADLFALGVILYQLLTGHLPFDGESVSEILFGIASKQAPPPSAVLRGIAPVFDGILERALAKDPAERFQTGKEMMQALSGIREEEMGRGNDPREAMAPPPTSKPGSPSPSRSSGTSWSDLNSPRSLGGLAVLLVLMFVLLSGVIRGFVHGPLRDVAGRLTGAATANDRPSGPPSERVDAGSDPAAAAGQFAQTALTRIVPENVLNPLRSRRRVDPSANLQMQMTHEMTSGRVIVRVDGETALAESIVARGGEGTVARQLSVTEGHHDIEVRLFDDDGGLRAASTIAGTVKSEGAAILLVQHRAGRKDALKLEWTNR